MSRHPVAQVERLPPIVEPKGPSSSAVLLVDRAPDRRIGGEAHHVLAASRRRDPSETHALTLQASALAEALPENWRVYPAVHGGHRGIDATLERVVSDGVTKVVLVPVDPYYCARTTGFIVKEFYRALQRRGPHLNVSVRARWHDDGAYLNALARCIAEHASRNGLRPEDTLLQFVASESGHDGDYRRQVDGTVRWVAQRVGWPTHRFSVVFADEWTDGAIPRPAGTEGCERALTCHLPFPTDPAEAAGHVKGVCPALHTFPPFVSALKSVVLHGPKPTPRRRGPPTPLLTRPPEEVHQAGEPARLLMIGASMEGSLKGGAGPVLRHSPPSSFGPVRKSRAELRRTLSRVQARPQVYEALVWSTCQRMEFYGFLEESLGGPGRDGLVARIRRELFHPEPPGLEVNVLWDLDARHHLTRTACGLNSDLPGDRDVTAQLQSSGRLARCAGTAGERVRSLVEDAVAVAEKVVDTTAWDRYATGYCAAALSRVSEVKDHALYTGNHVVIGGSATSRSILSVLCERHDVSQKSLTLIYRDHHGQMTELRAAVGCGTRLRVHSYSDRRVLRALAEADFVFFGIDRPVPVLSGQDLIGLRDFELRPLTIVDFNSSESLGGDTLPDGVEVWTLDDLDQVVAAHAAIATTTRGFADAVREVEECIASALTEADPEPLEASRATGRLSPSC